MDEELILYWLRRDPQPEQKIRLGLLQVDQARVGLHYMQMVGRQVSR